MPPEPEPDESHEELIRRCMADDESVEDFPDPEQRRAFCESQWERGQQDEDRTMSFLKTLRNTRAKAALAGLIARPKAGENGASLLNGIIDDQVTEDRTRADIIADMAQAAGIDESTVNDILNANINCPPTDRLQGFAESLDVAADTIIAAFEQDGCAYGDDE